jgi:hypothetical protein
MQTDGLVPELENEGFIQRELFWMGQGSEKERCALLSPVSPRVPYQAQGLTRPGHPAAGKRGIGLAWCSRHGEEQERSGSRPIFW